MLLYCWHDGQADQLRLSLVSMSHGQLPFSGSIERVADLSLVVQAFLDSAEPRSPLPVWTTALP
jgi:hypothetical protein